MNTELILFQKILFLELRPWTNRDIPEIKFNELIHSQIKEYYAFQPVYELDFPKPLTSKRKYYHLLIENEATLYLNKFHSIIAEALNDNEKSYWVHTTLTKVLRQKLKETSKIINDNSYFLETLEQGAKQKTADTKILDEIYILQFLKYQLIRIFLEIQETYESFLIEAAVTENDLHQLYFTEPIPVKSFLIEAPKIKVPATVSKIEIKNDEITITVLKADFRESKKGVLTYKEIIKDGRNFALFEEQLYLHGYIDENYNFKNNHGQIQELAAIYHILINKGYFNHKDFSTHTPIKPLHIRKFLDHRYKANTDKQFRTVINLKNNFLDIIKDNFWLETLPVC